MPKFINIMRCICSKESSSNYDQREVNKSQVHLLPPTKKDEPNGLNEGSTRSRPPSRAPSATNQNNSGSLGGSSQGPSKVNSGTLAINGYSSSLSNKKGDDHQGEKPKSMIVERPSRGSHYRRATVDLGVNGSQRPLSSLMSLVPDSQGETSIAGWPSWLSSVAAEAIQGWSPRRADSFEKLEKIGQGTYSSVYKARDLETGKLVAMKKVRFVNLDPESVRFMAREILILRKLDHPNVMKLEALVTSKSGSLYLVFEYMEHDLAGLLARPGNKFTEPQIKCYVQQLLSGLVHCHNRGILHRDIKGSNLLINNDGVLKIGDFGLATFFKPGQTQPLTSRVVTLWYRAPELLLGSTDYGIGVDMWSVGCIVAELFAGKPIMPGRTEVEQMHKIFKLCGSPSESYWKKTKFPHTTSFKPSRTYKRNLTEVFKDFPPPALKLVDALLSIEPEKRGTASFALKSEFFTAHPLPCDPSSLPKYPPTKEFDIKIHDEARRQKAETVKGRGLESVRRGPKESKPTQGYDADGDIVFHGQRGGRNYRAQGNGVTAYTIVHPNAAWKNKKSKEEIDVHNIPGRTHSSSKNGADVKSHNMASLESDLSNWGASTKENGYLPKKNRIHYSGPLVPPGENLEDMLKEHEKQIQQAVRKSRRHRFKDSNLL